MSSDQRLVEIRPSKRQMRVQEMEFYAFFHFTVNTFTNKEWGDGTENPSIFNPEKMDACQWVRAIKKAGMKGAILTCKHHDGFCLWPSKYTDHSIAFSPYKNGKGDLVKEVAQACEEGGIAFGIYLSPWDRHQDTYGLGKPYDDYFVAQMTELLTGYGSVFAVWLDGACGEGANGKKQRYDWNRYYETVRSIQPDAAIHICGPDIRWCGNEAGDTRESEWSVIPARMIEAEKTAEKSQKEDDPAFRKKEINSVDQDLGSREKLEKEENLAWFPAEVDMSIRPGWFYHPEEDNEVHSLNHLMKVYLNSVGGNCTFLLNIPPTKEGRIHPNDERRLEELGDEIRCRFADNLMEKALLEADSSDNIHLIQYARTQGYEEYFATQDGINHVEITITFPERTRVSYVILKENILLGQRIEKFQIIHAKEHIEQKIYEGTTVGYQKIACFEPILTKKLKIQVTDARVSVTLAFLGIY